MNMIENNQPLPPVLFELNSTLLLVAWPSVHPQELHYREFAQQKTQIFQ